MSKEVYRIEIPIETKDEYSSGINKAKSDVTRFEKEVNKTTRNINKRLDKMTNGRWSMTLRATDRASRVIRNVSSFARRVTNRTYRISMRALDLATRPIRGIASSIGSILATAGIVGGVAGGFVLPIKMQIERQNIKSQFEVLLGSADKAQKRMDDLVKFAGKTPYKRDEIFEASRVLEIFTKGALSTGSGLQMIGDIAAGTGQGFGDVALWMGRLYDAMASGRPVGEMTSRLQEMGAISGEARARLEKLAESGKDIKKIWPQATEEFERYNGMMGKLSENLGNLLLGAKTAFTENIIKRWGDGINNALSPALVKFKKWRSENEDGIQAMGDALERYGEKFTSGIVERFGSGFSYIDKLFFSDKYKNMSFGAKVSLMIDDAHDTFSDWWEKSGRDKVTRMGEKAGKTLGDTMKGFLLGVLGVESDDGYMSAGFEAGSSFVKGFLDGFDAGEVASAIGKKLLDINVQGASNATKGEGFGGLIGAGFVDLLVLGTLSKMLKLPMSGGKTVLNKTKGGIEWLLQRFGLVKGKGGNEAKPTNTPVNQPVPKSSNSPKPKPVIYDQYGKPISSGKNIPKIPKLPTGLKTKIGGPLGLLGTILTTDIAAQGIIDWLFGHNEGDYTRPGMFEFTRPGNEKTLFGKEREQYTDSRQGSLSKFWDWVWGNSSNTTPEKTNEFLKRDMMRFGQEDTYDTTSMESIGSFAQNEVKGNLDILATWTAQASNWVVGAFQPLQNAGQIVNQSLAALNTWTAQASGWIVGGIQPIQDAGGTVSRNLDILAGWTAQASGWVASISGIQDGASNVKSALDGLASRVRNTSVPSTGSSTKTGRPTGFLKYAKGTNFHPGGSAIVGDGGGSELIKYPNGRMSLSPSTDTLVNMPRGTKVLPHHKTKKLVDVPTYADGVGTFNTGETSSPIMIQIGDVIVQTSASNADVGDPKSFAQSIADDVANAIAEKMEQVSPNMAPI